MLPNDDAADTAGQIYGNLTSFTFTVIHRLTEFYANGNSDILQGCESKFKRSDISVNDLCQSLFQSLFNLYSKS